MRLRLTVAIALALAAGFGCPAATQDCNPSSDVADVTIGVRIAPPFIEDDPVRGRRGLTFDLWASIERDLQKAGVIGRTAFVECPLGAQLKALAEGKLDLVISPLTITAERLEHFEFTQQYLSSGLTVATRADGGIDFRGAAAILHKTMSREGVPRAILIFLVANLVLATLIARQLRQSDAFRHVAAEPLPLRLCRYGLETLVRTVGLTGLGGDARSTAARVVEVFIAVVGTILSATVFGMLTSALVGSMSGSDEITLRALAGSRIATLADSTAQAFFEQLPTEDAGIGLGKDLKLEPASLAHRPAPDPGRCVAVAIATPESRCVTTASWQEAIALLANGDVDFVLGDWAQLSYLSRLPDFAGRIAVQSTTFRLEPYGWGFSPRRPELRAAIDRELMARIRSTEWRFVVQQYMGSGSISPQ